MEIYSYTFVLIIIFIENLEKIVAFQEASRFPNEMLHR